MTIDAKTKKNILKDIIRDLHAGGNVEALQARFAALVKDVSGAEIGAMEQELIDEGLPETEVRRLCDLHVKVFESSLDARTAPQTEPGHPLHTLAEENRAVAALVAEARRVLDGLKAGAVDPAAGRARMAGLLEDLAQVEKHYLKKENQLFPRLEAKGVSGPSKVMWAVHDDIRAHLKDLRRALGLGDAELIVRTGHWVLQEIMDMVGKEEKVLFPMALELLDAGDWVRVKTGEEEIGYAWIPPAPAWPPPSSGRPAAAAEPGARTGGIGLDTGRLTPEQIDLMLTHLAGRHLVRGRERHRALLFGDAREDLPPDAGGHRPEGPELPSAQEPRRRRKDPQGLPGRRTRHGRVLDRPEGQVHPHPLLRPEGRGGRLQGEPRGQPGRDGDPGPPRRAAAARLGPPSGGRGRLKCEAGRRKIGGLAPGISRSET